MLCARLAFVYIILAYPSRFGMQLEDEPTAWAEFAGPTGNEHSGTPPTMF